MNTADSMMRDKAAIPMLSTSIEFLTPNNPVPSARMLKIHKPNRAAIIKVSWL